MNDARIEAAESQIENVNVRRSKLQNFIQKSKRWLFIPPIAIGLLVVVLMVRSKKEIPQSEIPEQSVKVTTIKAVSETIATQVTGYGTAQPARSWTAIAEVSGRIESIHPGLESGIAVKAGETLLKIDDEDYRLRVLQQSAELDSAKASLAELVANEAADRKLLRVERELVDVAKKDLVRSQRLRASNAVSVSEVDTSRSSLLLQQQALQRVENSLSLYPSRIQSAKAKVAMAESAVAEATRNVDRTTIVSPIDGVLSGVDLEPGQVVAPNQQLFEVQDNQRVEIEGQISLAQLNQLNPGIAQPSKLAKTNLEWLKNVTAEVISESGTQTFRWRGRPIRLTESVDSQTRTIGVVIEVLNQRNIDGQSLSDVGMSLQERPTELKIGTYCEVYLLGTPEEDVIAIPRTAFDGDQVYIVDEESRLRSRTVIRGNSVGDRVIVKSGIQDGNKVVVRPPLPAIEGMLVRQQ